jgi:hypothetical protein
MDTEPINEEIDEALLEYLNNAPWPDTFDLVDGLVGFGVYALERGPHAAAAVACVERVIDHLADMAEQRAEGIAWPRSTEWLPAELQEDRLGSSYDLGLAYGIPGVIAFLGRACAAGVAANRARPLLDGAVRWLLECQEKEGRDGFPCRLDVGLPSVPAQLTWRYGDPGVAVALLLAARCVDESAWESAALAIARRAAERPPERAGIFDGSLCQGAAGLAHIFNRMFQATGETWLSDASRFWFRRTLQLRRPQGSINGFAAWGPGPDGVLDWTDELGFLTGTAGLALALLAAATPVEPTWDRVLLLSAPAANGRIGRLS